MQFLRVGVDAGGGHLGVSQDALYDVDVYVQLAEQRSGGVARVVQPNVFDPGLTEDFLPFPPIDVRVDRVAVRLAPNQVPFLPRVTRRFLFGILRFAVHPQCGDERGRQGSHCIRLVLNSCCTSLAARRGAAYEGDRSVDRRR